jgi:hypothetical protein
MTNEDKRKMIPLSDKEISTIEAALYRFVKDNEIDMSQELRDECVELYRRFRILEGMPMNLQ